MSRRVRFRVIPNENGMALRTLLARRLQCKPPQASSLIRAGGVYVNKLRVRIPNVRVATGERITAYPGADEIERIDPAQLRIVHRDPSLCVIDKAPGVSAEFARETCFGTLSDALLRLLSEEGVNRPYVGIVHALEPRACGLVMFSTRGLTDPNHHRTLVEHPIRRHYRMLVREGPPATTRVELALVEQRDNSLRAPRDAETGRAETLEFVPVGHAPAAAGFAAGDMLETTLLGTPTARIRLHARAAGYPIQGDEPDAQALALWCARMEFEHPVTREPMTLEAAAPPWAPPDTAATGAAPSGDH